MRTELEWKNGLDWAVFLCDFPVIDKKIVIRSIISYHRTEKSAAAAARRWGNLPKQRDEEVLFGHRDLLRESAT